MEYFERQRQIEADMCFRNPWFNLFYNWLIGITIIALMASFVWWGIDIHRRNRDEQIRLQVLAEMGAEGGDLITEISKPEQFTGYSDANPVLAEYKNLAQRLVEEWHSETIKPCDVSFRFAELTPNGIYLKQDLHADGYARRWHA